MLCAEVALLKERLNYVFLYFKVDLKFWKLLVVITNYNSRRNRVTEIIKRTHEKTWLNKMSIMQQNILVLVS